MRQRSQTLAPLNALLNALATVGIAMGTAGSDVALETLILCSWPIGWKS
jgi:hypothetical protein